MAASNWPQLLAYVMRHGGFSESQAEQWLDSHCLEWRTGEEVIATGQIWLEEAGGEHERNEQ